MAKLLWDQIGERIYETGDKNVALYPYSPVAATTWVDGSGTEHTFGTGSTHYPMGYAWNGITAITESPSGAEATDLWADDDKYATLRSAEQFGGTIEAYTYPDAWGECDGSASPIKGITLGQQKRKAFGLAYITTVGNDAELNDFGEKLHLIYNATASPAERSYATINDSPEAITFSWEYTTTPIEVGKVNDTEYKKVSCITIDTSKFRTAAGTIDTEMMEYYEAFKNQVFGVNPVGGAGEVQPHLPEPASVFTFFGSVSAFKYVKLTSETAPDDWTTKYMDYYTKSGDTYSRIGDLDEAPTYAANTYYERVRDTE
jgi:hypothetical protein